MKIEKHFYAKAKEDACYISEIAHRMETIEMMFENKIADESLLGKKYEERQLRDIKNALTNIYLLLKLHEVKGIADQVFNSEWKPKE